MKPFLVILLFAGLAVSSAAQIAAKWNKASYVTLEPMAEVRLSKSKPAKALVRFRVNPGFHVNSNQPKSDLLIPTEIKFESLAGVVVGAPVYPAGQDFALSFSPGQKLSVYQGDVQVSVPLSAAKSAKAGAYKLKGSLSYQACNDNACFPPKTVPFELSLVID